MMNRISISQAAAQFGISRRTLERWIRDGRLTAVPNAKDGRQRLVDPVAVRLLVGQMPKRRPHRKALAADDEPAVDDDHEAVDARYRRAIDKALLQVHRMHRLLLSRLDADAEAELTLEELREGPLGRNLERLAAYAQGQAFDDSRLVRAAIESVLEVLFWPTASEDYTVPRAFWDTDLGKLLGRAKARAYKPEELVSLAEAVRLLGVTTPTVYRWMDDRTLGWVRDDDNGRTWIVRRDIEQLKRKAAELVPRQTVPERALAS